MPTYTPRTAALVLNACVLSSLFVYFVALRPHPAAAPAKLAPRAPVHCDGSWPAAWGPCSASCGGGVRTRAYVVARLARYGGARCPPAESEPCSPAKCPLYCPPRSVLHAEPADCARRERGQTCVPRCVAGYTAQGKLSCVAAGAGALSLQGEATCAPSACAPFTMPKAKNECTGVFGDKCLPECPRRRRLAGELRCGEEGLWVGEAACVKAGTLPRIAERPLCVGNRSGAVRLHGRGAALELPAGELHWRRAADGELSLDNRAACALQHGGAHVVFADTGEGAIAVMRLNASATEYARHSTLLELRATASKLEACCAVQLRERAIVLLRISTAEGPTKTVAREYLGSGAAEVSDIGNANVPQISPLACAATGDGHALFVASTGGLSLFRSGQRQQPPWQPVKVAPPKKSVARSFDLVPGFSATVAHESKLFVIGGLSAASGTATSQVRHLDVSSVESAARGWTDVSKSSGLRLSKARSGACAASREDGILVAGGESRETQLLK